MEINEQQKQALLENLTFKDSLCRYEIAPQTAKPLISLYLIQGDIEDMIACIDSVNLLLKIRKKHTIETVALWQKLIIDYGKIFLHSRDGFSQLKADYYFKKESELALHNEIMLVRHSFLAHRGYNDYEYHIMVADVVGTKQNCKLVFSVPGIKKYGNFFEPVIIRQHLRKLAKRVKQQLNSEVEELERDVYDEIGLEPRN